jgi:hypothetical protein
MSLDNDRSRTADDHSSFEHITSFDSAPPPGGAGDVHNARTAIATLPDSFLDDLRKAKVEEPPTARYKVLEDVHVNATERPAARTASPPLPPLPPRRRAAAAPTGQAEARMSTLNAAVGAALAAAIPREDPEADADAATAMREWPRPTPLAPTLSTPAPYLPMSAPPMSAPPMSAPPMSAPPMSAAPMSAAPPMSAPPMSAAPLSAAPLSAPPMSDAPMSDAPMSAAPPLFAPLELEAPASRPRANAAAPARSSLRAFFAGVALVAAALVAAFVATLMSWQIAGLLGPT